MVRAARAARVAVVAAPGTVAVTRNVRGALHNDVVVTVVAVHQKSEELGGRVRTGFSNCTSRSDLRRR